MQGGSRQNTSGGSLWPAPPRKPQSLCTQWTVTSHRTLMWDQPILHLHASYQSGWMWFFNSIVAGLPIHSISDGSECWLFYILVVILMWLCKEMSHVYLCLHLDQKVNWVSTMVQKWFIRGRIVFSPKGAGTIGYPYPKEKERKGKKRKQKKENRKNER